jgi:glutamate-5-semialdehyde dehydrogenase
MPSTSLTRSLHESVQITRKAARVLAKLPTQIKDGALEAIAVALEKNSDQILAANQKDVEIAKSTDLPSAILSRLKLDRHKLAAMVAGVRDVTRLAEPVGITQIDRELDSGLNLARVTCPLGVVGVIFEARPDAVSQIAALAIKSGNGVILKGGSEAVNSCEAIVAVIHQALRELEIANQSKFSVSPDVVQLLTTRAETSAILQMDTLIDLIIPRGSNQFVRYIQDNTRIPVLGHAEGICHLYVDAGADIAQAIAIAVDAKTQYPAACNAIETLLVHEAIASDFLALAIPTLQLHGVELRGCDRTLKFGQSNGQSEAIIPATELDWATEYGDLILAIRVVDSLEAAIAHINTYGSRHTEAIVTQDADAAASFLSDVDAAGVFQNCSTRFADGFRYGFGAEVGISTQKMPPRGPVGLEGLITYKYRLIGDGHVVADYSGKDAKTFTHRDL